jgi:hypothetical protein
MDEGMSHLIFLAVPLFVFLGLLIEMTGMARAMVGFLASLLGHVRGGLHYVLVGAMYLVSGISGSKAADMAAVAPVLFPEMTKRGAKPGDLVALLAATGAQTGNNSTVLGADSNRIGDRCFDRALWRYRGEDLSQVQRATGREIGRAFLVAIPTIARGAVVEGVAIAAPTPRCWCAGGAAICRSSRAFGAWFALQRPGAMLFPTP